MSKKTPSDRHFVKKPWGSEDWVANSELYCGKILTVNQGKKCSFHKHVLKDETFLCFSGKILLKYGYDEDISKATEIILNPGDSFHIPVGLIHQFYGLEDSKIMEFSTQHFDSDSYRIVPGDV
jgi:mannose-6-phosphate isomerase-like protein (cupin superfamily)